MKAASPPRWTVDRTGWPAGPWDGEPDRVAFTHAGFACLVVRAPQGHLCGYVGVPSGHPFHGLDRLALWRLPSLPVHGGLPTYARACDWPICHADALGAEPALWWIGFDCAHRGDLVPALRAPRNQVAAEVAALLTRLQMEMPHEDERRGGVYRTVEAVRENCERLAEALRALHPPPPARR